MTIDVPGNTNRELFAGDKGMKETLSGNLSAVKDPQLHSLLARIAGTAAIYRPGGRILTDDKAPVELLGMQELDSLIRQESEPYKEIYKKEGLSGLMKAL